MKQLSLFPNSQKLFYGGRLFPGKRKTARPLCGKRPIHLVLKAKRKILFAKKKKLEPLFSHYGRRFGVKIYSLSIQKDHIHALIKVGDRKSYVAFIRSLCGQAARLFGKNLFQFLPFTRIVAWGRDFRQAKAYLLQNEREALGLQEYVSRKDYYKRFYMKHRRHCPPGMRLSMT